MVFAYAKKTTPRAKKKPGFSMTAKGTKPPLGEGGRFKALTTAIEKRGKVKNPAAVAAFIGRKKYGKTAFQKMAVAGRKKK